MKALHRSHEPLTWGLFGAGGMVLAFVTPALLILTAVVLPWLWQDTSAQELFLRTSELVSQWWLKGALGLLITLQAFHAVHRIYHGLHDLHVRLPSSLLFAALYGLAFLVSAAGWYYLAVL
jgi:fumarate reductase subunit D